MVKFTDGKSEVSQGKVERVLSLLGTAIKDLKIITDAFDSVYKTVDQRNTTNTDNTIKVCNAKNDAKKEDNRHDEAMANIELAYQGIVEDSASGKLKWSMIQSMVQMLVAESNKINGMADSDFLSNESRVSRDELHRTMLELSKEILKA